jgi:hypothetical protein
MNDTLKKDGNAKSEDLKILRRLTDNSFSMLDCKKALHQNESVEEAMEDLMQGNWRRYKLISWDQEGLSTACKNLSQKTGKTEGDCREKLMNCAGNERLAEMMLARGTRK